MCRRPWHTAARTARPSRTDAPKTPGIPRLRCAPGPGTFRGFRAGHEADAPRRRRLPLVARRPRRVLLRGVARPGRADGPVDEAASPARRPARRRAGTPGRQHGVRGRPLSDAARRPDGKDKNVFFSPYSISLALAMAYAGAHGNTETQMASAMHYTLPQAQLHPALDALDLALSSRGQGAKGDDGKAFRLRVTNSMWGAPPDDFAPSYLDTIAQNYGAGIRLTDFAKNPEAARARSTRGSISRPRIASRSCSRAGSSTIRRGSSSSTRSTSTRRGRRRSRRPTHAGTFHGVAGDLPRSS